MRETSKCHEERLRLGHFDKYLVGNGIDIGAGNDPLQVPNGTVRPWDRKQGDAQFMASEAPETYDFVYSSHCLEHIVDIEVAMSNWTRILKPSGILYVVVPDYLTYEKGSWPSRFNRDHKHSFSMDINRSVTGRTNHWKLPVDIEPSLSAGNVSLVECYATICGIDWATFFEDHTKRSGICHITLIGRKRVHFQGNLGRLQSDC